MRPSLGVVVLCAAAASFAVAACGSTDDNVDGTHQSTDAGPDAGPTDAGHDAGLDAGQDGGEDAGTDGGSGAVVFLLQVSPDLEPVDVFIGSTEVADNIAFGHISPAITVEAAPATLDLFAHASGDARPAGDPLASLDMAAPNAGTQNLAIVTGFATPTGGERGLELVALEDGFGDPGTKVLVRGVHASPDAPALDLGAVIPGIGFLAIPETSNVAFGNSSPAEGFEVNPMPVKLGVAPTGTTTPAAVFSLSPSAGQALFGVAAGAFTAEAGEAPFQLILVDTAVTPWVATPVLKD